MEEDDRAKAAHEEETEYYIGVDWGCKEEEASIVFVPRRYVGIITASVVHDGTWACEKAQLERCERQSQSPSLIHFTVWNRPEGLRGRYLDLRSRLWQWQRAFLRTCDRIGRLVTGR